jgi:hypothetical protein
MKFRTYFLLKGVTLFCAVPFVSTPDAKMLLLVAVLSCIGGALIGILETEK